MGHSLSISDLFQFQLLPHRQPLHFFVDMIASGCNDSIERVGHFPQSSTNKQVLDGIQNNTRCEGL